MKHVLKFFLNSSAKPTNPRRTAPLFALLTCVLLFACTLSLCLGAQPLRITDVLRALLTQDAKDTTLRILLHVRIPRMLAALLAGGALSLAGTLLQSVLHNPMAGPNVIGVNAGAGFAVMLVTSIGMPLSAMTGIAAFIGAFLTALFIYALSARVSLSRTTLILSGVAVNSILNAGINVLTLFFPDGSIGVSGFMIGGFSGVTLVSLKSALPYLLIGALIALALRTELNVLQLGDETAASLGVHLRRTRLLSIAAAALLAGAAVSFAGLISFAGLLFPHIARRIFGHDNRVLMPAATLLGGTFVLLCDTFARTAFAPFEVPVGIVMALLGGPFFLYLLLHSERRDAQ